MGDARSPMSVAKVRGTENALEATSLRARGLTFREIGAELGMSAPGAHKAVKRGLALIAEQIRDAAEELRAKESATLDALHEAFLPDALNGDPRAAEIVLKVRRDYHELNDLDLQRPREEDKAGLVVYTGLPPEVLAMRDQEQIVDEEPVGELGTGAE